jgi:adenine-specific DNA methylase
MSNSKKFFGKHYWFVIHALSLKLSREQFFEFLGYLTFLLPCAECRLHLKENIKTLQMMEGDAFGLSWSLHEIVNKMIGNKGVTFLSAKAFYLKNGSSGFVKELIWVLRLSAYKYDFHRKEFEMFLNFVTPYASNTFKRALNNAPLTKEYETAADIFFWSVRLGALVENYWGIQQTPDEKIFEEFRVGFSDKCDECDLS